ncbi:hypothetical protein INT48_002995 [Thamnidium elegans]|uniref:Uncharacterized protein n=1 Tax=Thamnidium elegans TaxID=101142 RepID=A0A8H7SJP8_9FUNG|nr:hypothetical protein INT48_002995 [Thamnidium elegans]
MTKIGFKSFDQLNSSNNRKGFTGVLRTNGVDLEFICARPVPANSLSLTPSDVSLKVDLSSATVWGVDPGLRDAFVAVDGILLSDHRLPDPKFPYNAEEKTVTLDGNFQLKRLKSRAATEVNTGIFSPSSAEKRLWGDEQEVQKFGREAEANKDEDCLVQNIMDNKFKATSNNNRQLNKRYAENSVFSMGCARHGIPERLYNISGGEGFKYAFACVNYALGSTAKINVMYDIVCRCKSRLESTFPQLKGMSRYAVTAFHAYAHTRIPPLVRYGEGYERVWSYLDKFVSMTRTMTSGNRKMVICDAVHHFKTKKMAVVRKFNIFIYQYVH